MLNAAPTQNHCPAHLCALKDLTFRILVALGDGELHGWALVQALGDPDPARTSRVAAPSQIFSLTTLGRAMARAETDRLEALVASVFVRAARAAGGDMAHHFGRQRDALRGHPISLATLWGVMAET